MSAHFNKFSVADHERVEAYAAHHGEVLAVHLPHVDGAVGPVQADLNCLFEIDRDTQVVGEQVRRTGGEDGKRDVRPNSGIDAALDAPIATPDEYEVGPEPDRLPHPPRDLPALGYLEPDRIRHALLAEHITQPAEAPAQHLPVVRDHCY